MSEKPNPNEPPAQSVDQPQTSDSIIVPPAADSIARHKQVELAEVPPLRAVPGSRTGILVAQATMFTGPLPHPEHLRIYEQVLPGSAERIFRAWETESTHRRQLEDRALTGELTLKKAGLKSAFWIGTFGLAVAAWLGFLGHAGAAATVGGLGLGSLVGVFVTGRVVKAKQQPTETKDDDS